MLKKLSFQKKLFICYSLVLTIIISILTIIFYFYLTNILVEQESKSMEQTVEKIRTGLQQMITQMDVISTQVLSSKGIQDIMAEALQYSNTAENFFDNTLKSKQSARDILFSINSIKSTARRIVIFNENGSYLSIGKALEDSPPDEKYFKKTSWYEEIHNSNDKSIVVPPHKDNFISGSDPTIVVSFIREMFSTFGWYKHLGYVEIQQPYSMIQDICKAGDSSGLQVIVLNEKSDMIYPLSNITSPEKKYYQDMKNVNGVILQRPWDKVDELVYTKSLSNANWKVILIKTKHSFLSPVYKIQSIILFSGFLLIALTLAIVFFVTNSLTIPIKEMRKSLKNLTVENLQIQPGSQTNNEIVLLNNAFNHTLQQLKVSIEQTIQARIGEMQANFLAMQSQMNPHFLYNSLSLISSTGYEIGNTRIITICSLLAKMLRYISSYETSEITMKDEFSYARNYLEILKFRFEDQLNFEFDIDEALYDIPVPKLILQPIIENSYTHGFSKTKPPWYLKVKGWIDNGNWIVEVTDNGIGISEDKLCEISNKISGYEKQIRSGCITNKLDIGGMGMVNIYARLFILYNGDVIFKAGNNINSGAKVTLGGPLKNNRGALNDQNIHH